VDSPALSARRCTSWRIASRSSAFSSLSISFSRASSAMRWLYKSAGCGQVDGADVLADRGFAVFFAHVLSSDGRAIGAGASLADDVVALLVGPSVLADAAAPAVAAVRVCRAPDCACVDQNEPTL